jgi:phytoene dehydrogenase-like protein
MPGQYDAIIIGAGHNGLVTACYLARAGKKVLVLERRELVGGACVTEETFPGFKVSTCAYVNSLFRKEIIDELNLKAHGFELLERQPSSFSPFLDGRYLMMGGDKELTHREISKFSRKDAEAYPKYEAMLERVADLLEPTLIQKPPNVLRPGLSDLWKMYGLGRGFQKMGTAMSEAVEILTGPARTILDRWFESEELKATLATDAIIGAFAAPSMPGTAYVLFHHVMGETNGKRGVWAYVKGGMGALSNALASVARSLGAEIRTNASVGRINVKDGVVTGVSLATGDEFTAKIVASNADCHITFNKLMDSKVLPPDFAEAINRIGYESASLKINVALERLPSFTCLPGHDVGPQHRGTVHVCPDQDYIERAYDDAKYGKPSANPVLECTMASAVDPTIAPAGKHLMSMFIQYAPYKLKEGDWDSIKDAFADRCFDILEEYAPGFKSSVIARQVVTPLDLERTFSLTGGNIFQGAMTLNQLFMMRPLPGWSGYKTPIKGLYLCGSAAHPGGGVIGAAGWNAAKVILGKM